MDPLLEAGSVESTSEMADKWSLRVPEVRGRVWLQGGVASSLGG